MEGGGGIKCEKREGVMGIYYIEDKYRFIENYTNTQRHHNKPKRLSLLKNLHARIENACLLLQARYNMYQLN